MNQQDVDEFTKTCLVGKILCVPLDIRTIVSKMKSDWKFIKGDVEYLEMENHWILMRFANPNDLFLVWYERTSHVQGDLFVIQSCNPGFDPFLEEIKWVHIWVCILDSLQKCLISSY